ncbi:MAG TPA: hydrogenase maturation protease [Candidatus Acidoferrales bacterium]|nr:hydrogenase maturation protease [Candidatus Acidoferrales bacterium]
MNEFESEVAGVIEGCAGSKIAFLGIGNELKRDDAVGLAVVNQLSTYVDDPSISIINCHDVPENFTGYLKRLKARCVVLIDATDFGGSPGEARLFELDAVMSSAVVTHRASLDVLGTYLRLEAGAANVFLIGIQPVNCDIGDELSPAVAKASATVAKAIGTALNRFPAKNG